MISKEQIQKFKGRRELFMHRLSTAEEEDKHYYKRRLRALEMEERDAWKDDLVQPDEDRFKTLYRNEWLKNEKEKEQKHFKNIKEKASRDKFYKDNLLEGKERVKRALDLEEQIANG